MECRVPCELCGRRQDDAKCLVLQIINPKLTFNLKLNFESRVLGTRKEDRAPNAENKRRSRSEREPA